MASDPRAAKPHQDKGVFVKLPLVNQIRQRVDVWRDAGYPGITGMTSRWILQKTVDIADIAPTVDGQADVSMIQDIDLEQLSKKFRKQTMIFRAAQQVYREISANWRSSEVVLIAELVRLAGQCIDSDCMQITPKMYNDDNKKKTTRHSAEYDQSHPPFLAGDRIS